MKKDIEWLKEAIEGIISNYESFSDKTDWNDGYIMALHDYKDLINQLDEPEVLSQEWLDENKSIWTKLKIDGYYIPVAKLQNLLVPKQEEITEEQAWEVIHGKYGDELLQNNIDYVESQGYVVTERPTIPQFIADYLPLVKEDIELEKASYYAVTDNELPKWKREYDWIRENFETFVKAWLAYPNIEVEEEQKFYVLNENKQLMLKKHEGEVKSAYNSLRGVGENYLTFYQLTEQEIKDYDPRYFAFAVKVEELEE